MTILSVLNWLILFLFRGRLSYKKEDYRILPKVSEQAGTSTILYDE